MIEWNADHSFYEGMQARVTQARRQSMRGSLRFFHNGTRVINIVPERTLEKKNLEGSTSCEIM